MSILTRVALSWVAVVAAVALAARDLFLPGTFGDPTIILPLAVAYLLRYDVRPEIPRERAPSRRWLIVPLGSFLLYMILTADILLVVAIVTAAVWGVRDDMSIYRHRSHERPTG